MNDWMVKKNKKTLFKNKGEPVDTAMLLTVNLLIVFILY